MQHLGINLGNISRFKLGFLYLGFLLKKSGLIFNIKIIITRFPKHVQTGTFNTLHSYTNTT